MLKNFDENHSRHSAQSNEFFHKKEIKDDLMKKNHSNNLYEYSDIKLGEVKYDNQEKKVILNNNENTIIKSRYNPKGDRRGGRGLKNAES